MTRKHTLVSAVLCVLVAAAGILTPAWAGDGIVLPLPQEDQQKITAHLGAGVVGQALPSLPITDTSVYFPLRNRSANFLVTSGKHQGQTQTLAVTRRDRPTTERPAWRTALAPTLAGFLRQTTAGDLMMASVTDSDHDVIVVTNPANPFVLQNLQPGESRSFSQTVSVFYLDDPTRRDYSGTMKGTFTYVGTYQLTVPAGTYPAVLMRTKVDGKIGPAHTQDTAYYMFAPQVGVVAMINQEDVEAFWIIHIDSSSGKVLASN